MVIGHSLFIFSTAFINNHALNYNILSGYTGTIEFENGLFLTAINSQFIGNSKVQGAAFYISLRENHNQYIILFLNCLFLNNTAKIGSMLGLVNYFPLRMSVHQCQFLLNLASESNL